MKNFKKWLMLVVCALAASSLLGQEKDWANFGRYAELNKTVELPSKVVFMGNSITEGWWNNDSLFFKNNGFIGRGISGQTTAQMLVRFRADVINLKPKAVVILAGTNDIAQNNGYISQENILGNIISMTELAKANHIDVILCSVLPAYDFGWRKGLEPADKIIELNKMIKAYAEMVRDISYNDDDKRNANLNVIVMEVDRLNILVNDILVLSRLQAGAESLEIEKFDLNFLVRDCLTRYDIYKEDGYEFVYSFNGKSAMIEADKKRMQQVIYNAVQYTGDDKKIFIDVSESKKWIIFSVRDTGKGMKKEEIRHIWDKYYKIDKKYKRSTVGSGIGLSIVKTICENHKFLYGVDTEVNHGSKFWVKIRKK